LAKFEPDFKLPVCADCRSTSLEEQAKPAHPTSVGNPVVTRKPSLRRLGQVACRTSYNLPKSSERRFRVTMELSIGDTIKPPQQYNYNNKVMDVILGIWLT